MKLYLPKSAEESIAPVLKIEKEAVSVGDETILVVEDEEDVRVLTGALLRSLGYKVLEAANGNDALDLIDAG